MFIHLTCLRRNSMSLMFVSTKSSITLQKSLTTSFACSTIALLYADTSMVGTIDHQHPVHMVTVRARRDTYDTNFYLTKSTEGTRVPVTTCHAPRQLFSLSEIKTRCICMTSHQVKVV